MRCHSRAGGNPGFPSAPPRAATGKRMRKFLFIEEEDFAMDIERINDIGNLLADLTSRTEALRRYL